MKKKIGILSLFLLLVVFVVSCSKVEVVETSTTCEVTYTYINEDLEEVTESITVEQGTLLDDVIEIPTLEGYEFLGWYDNEGIKYEIVPNTDTLSLTANYNTLSDTVLITYIYNGTSVISEEFVGNSLNLYNVIDIPSGYVIESFTDEEGNILTTVPEADTTIYVNFTIDSYDVEINFYNLDIDSVVYNKTEGEELIWYLDSLEIDKIETDEGDYNFSHFSLSEGGSEFTIDEFISFEGDTLTLYPVYEFKSLETKIIVIDFKGEEYYYTFREDKYDANTLISMIEDATNLLFYEYIDGYLINNEIEVDSLEELLELDNIEKIEVLVEAQSFVVSLHISYFDNVLDTYTESCEIELDPSDFNSEFELIDLLNEIDTDYYNTYKEYYAFDGFYSDLEYTELITNIDTTIESTSESIDIYLSLKYSTSAYLSLTNNVIYETEGTMLSNYYSPYETIYLYFEIDKLVYSTDEDLTNLLNTTKISALSSLYGEVEFTVDNRVYEIDGKNYLKVTLYSEFFVDDGELQITSAISTYAYHDILGTSGITSNINNSLSIDLSSVYSGEFVDMIINSRMLSYIPNSYYFNTYLLGTVDELDLNNTFDEDTLVIKGNAILALSVSTSDWFFSNYIFAGTFDLNSYTLTYTNSSYNTPVFYGFYGTIKNGNINLDTLKEIGDVANDVLAHYIFENSAFESITLTTSLGFKFTDDKIYANNFIVGIIGTDVDFSGLTLNVKYYFESETENFESLRVSNYLATNTFAPFKEVLGTYNYGDEEVAREISLTITITDFVIDDIVANADSSLIYIGSGLGDIDNDYGYYLPSIYFFAISANTNNGPWYSGGFVSAGDDTLVGSGDLLNNSIEVKWRTTLFSGYNIVRENFDYVTSYTYYSLTRTYVINNCYNLTQVEVYS